MKPEFVYDGSKKTQLPDEKSAGNADTSETVVSFMWLVNWRFYWLSIIFGVIDIIVICGKVKNLSQENVFLLGKPKWWDYG